MNNAHRQTLEMAGKFQAPAAGQHRIAQMEVEYLGRSFGCSGKFPVELRVQFALKPVDPVILPKCEALQSGITTLWLGRGVT